MAREDKYQRGCNHLARNTTPKLGPPSGRGEVSSLGLVRPTTITEAVFTAIRVGGRYGVFSAQTRHLSTHQGLSVSQKELGLARAQFGLLLPVRGWR